MNRESLNPKVELKNNKKMGVLALLGIAVVATMAMFGGYDATQSAVADEAAIAHLQSLVDHQQFLADQHQTIGDLIEEGVENQVAITGALAAIAKAETFAKMAAPIVKGVGKIAKNIIWGKNITVKTVDPKKIDAAFNDSRVFISEIKKRFGKSHKVIA